MYITHEPASALTGDKLYSQIFSRHSSWTWYTQTSYTQTHTNSKHVCRPMNTCIGTGAYETHAHEAQNTCGKNIWMTLTGKTLIVTNYTTTLTLDPVQAPAYIFISEIWIFKEILNISSDFPLKILNVLNIQVSISIRPTTPRPSTHRSSLKISSLLCRIHIYYQINKALSTVLMFARLV